MHVLERSVAVYGRSSASRTASAFGRVHAECTTWRQRDLFIVLFGWRLSGSRGGPSRRLHRASRRSSIHGSLWLPTRSSRAHGSHWLSTWRHHWVRPTSVHGCSTTRTHPATSRSMLLRRPILHGTPLRFFFCGSPDPLRWRRWCVLLRRMRRGVRARGMIRVLKGLLGSRRALSTLSTFPTLRGGLLARRFRGTPTGSPLPLAQLMLNLLKLLLVHDFGRLGRNVGTAVNLAPLISSSHG